jgi:hypothetical protein
MGVKGLRTDDMGWKLEIEEKEDPEFERGYLGPKYRLLLFTLISYCDTNY